MRKQIAGPGMGVLAAVLLAVSIARAGTEGEKPVWPSPPEVARIEFVRTLTGTKDFSKGFFGRLSDFATGKGSEGNMVKPTGIAVSADGMRVYVLDGVKLAVFRFDLDRKRVRVLPLTRFAHSPGSPFDVALDADENLYVTDQSSRTVVVLDREGEFLRAIGGGVLERPVGCAVDRARRILYVVDAPHGAAAQHRVAVFDLAGTFRHWLGERGSGPSQFNFPTYLAVDAAGELHVVDTLNWRVQVFDAEGRYLRAFGRHGDARGDLDRPKGVSFDAFGNVYLADSSWDRVLIFTRSGRPLLDFGGRGTWPGGLQEPTAVSIDAQSTIYVADTNGHRVNVYRLINTTAADTSASGGGRPLTP